MVNAGSLGWLGVGSALVFLTLRLNAPPLTWVAMAIVYHASRAMPLVSGPVLLWLGLYVAFAAGQRGILPLAGAAYFALVALTTSEMALPFVLDRVAGPRLIGVASTLVFPAAWVAVEFLRSRLTSAGTWGAIGYSQYGNLAVMQVAAFVGIWGISFLIAWFASTLNWAWARGFAWPAVRTPVLTYLAVFSVALIVSTARLALAPTDRPSIRVATLNRPVDLFVPGEMTRISEGRVAVDERARIDEKLARLHDWFLEGSRREARAGARLIVWPEQNLLVFSEDEPAFLDRARRLAAQEGVYLAMGMGTIHRGDALPFENKLVLVDPSGRIAVSYLKSHPVRGWEAGIMKPGDGRLPVVSTSAGRMGVAICFDGDFPEFVRQAAVGRADFLILPVNDWKEVKDLHFRMAAFRAVETGVPMIRAATSGLSSAFDPWGRVLGLSDYFSAGDRTMTVQLPVGGVRTLYAKTGDLFAWLCVAGLLVGLGLAAASTADSPHLSATIGSTRATRHRPTDFTGVASGHAKASVGDVGCGGTPTPIS